MNFERRGSGAFNQDNFPLPGNDLASAHVGPEEVILVENENREGNFEKEKIPLYDGDEMETQDFSRRREEQHHLRFSKLEAVDARRKSNNAAKNAKREERPKGFAKLPPGLN